MLIFRSEDHVNRWCELHDLPPGQQLTVETAWRLAQAWYVNKAKPEWRRHTLEETEALFRQLGLTDSFWALR